ncbi:MAG: 2-dehydropantoate 2-reductase [Chloroflexi bacterium]|nr:MAG: 2-dehydropantoate 2-reductase [Chloroflexota bacterium]
MVAPTSTLYWSISRCVNGNNVKIVVVGAGAMGGLFGARLAAAGNDVILHDTWQEHVQAIQRDGLVITELDGTDVRYRLPATTDVSPEAGSADLLLVEVKAYDTFEALQPYDGVLGEQTVVLSLQNGLGNLEQIRAALPRHPRVALGTSAHGSMVLGPGRLHHAGKGPNVIGVPPRRQDDAEVDLTPVARAFNAAGFETEIAADVRTMIWRKLMANVAINAISALTGALIGEIPQDADLLAIATAAVQEATAVMAAEGVPGEDEDYVSYAQHIMELTARNRASMLQDILRGKRTEIDAINGAVAWLAEQHGIAAPTNRMLAALVRSRERAIRASIGERG